jgi:hypothetical protein
MREMCNMNVVHYYYYYHHHNYYHHLSPPWLRAFDLFRHRRVDKNVFDKQLRLTGKAIIKSERQYSEKCYTSSWTIKTGSKYSVPNLQPTAENTGPNSTLPWGQENHRLVKV